MGNETSSRNPLKQRRFTQKLRSNDTELRRARLKWFDLPNDDERWLHDSLNNEAQGNSNRLCRFELTASERRGSRRCAAWSVIVR